MNGGVVLFSYLSRVHGLEYTNYQHDTSMQHILRGVVALVIAAGIAGCLKTKRDFTINPDGSGKVTIETTMTRPDFLMGAEGKSKKQRQEELLEKVGEIIAGSEGVDVWKDVSYKDLGEGKIFFKGTAYFPDFNTVRFKGLSNINFHLGMDGGRMHMALADESEPSSETDTTIVMENISEEELQRRADSIQQEFKMSMALLRVALEEMEETTTFLMPGKKVAADVFAYSRGRYRISFNGATLIQIMDSLANERKVFLDMARYGGRPPLGDEESRLMVWGGVKPQLVVDPGAKPLFNYAREVRGARKSYAALRKKLNIDE